MWHGPFRVSLPCGDHAARLKIAGTPYIMCYVVHVSKLKRLVKFLDLLSGGWMVDNGDRVDFDKSIQAEDS